jgi:hypothetical protein
MAGPRPATEPAILAVFDTMIAGVKGVERKGATMPYVSINGNMYAMINKAGVIGLRLAGEDRATFFATFGDSPFEGVPGFVNTDYVAIPEALYGKAKMLHAWFKISHAAAGRLPPRPTRR